MANTYTLIASSTVGSGGSGSITFGSIPATYTDLQVLMSARVTSGSATQISVFMKVNNLTSSIYSQRTLEGDGSSASSFSQSGTDGAVRIAIANNSGSTASTFSNSSIYIPNYAGSNKKSASVDTVNETNGTTQYMNLIAYLVDTTDAVTSLTFTPETGAVSFAQYSTFYLYGISNS